MGRRLSRINRWAQSMPLFIAQLAGYGAACASSLLYAQTA